MEELIPIFCEIDDYCKAYEEYCTKSLFMDKNSVIPQTSLSLSEIMTITIYFHLSGYRTFKWYYTKYVQKTLKSYFPKLVSYNRFIEIMKMAFVPITLYTIKNGFGKCSGINFLDSTSIDVCDNHRIYSHKIFKDFAQRGHSSTGWFYGFKLHLIINDKGEILSFCLTSANVDDRNWDVISHLTKELYGKVFADRGYISAKLFEKLYERGITLVTRIRSNMKNKLVDLYDKIILRKRAVIESVNDFLKNICQIEHSRHRSIPNFLVNLVSAIAAYSFIPKKPSVFIDNTDNLALCV